jgi:hypothetical protein
MGPSGSEQRLSIFEEIAEDEWIAVLRKDYLEQLSPAKSLFNQSTGGVNAARAKNTFTGVRVWWALITSVAIASICFRFWPAA